MVKKMKTRSRAALAVLPSLFFWGACELPKGAEVTGEPRIYLPLGNVLSRQDTYSFAGEFLDPDTINDNVNDAEFYGITDEDKSRRKAWNDIRPEIRVNPDGTTIDGTKIQTFLVYIPACRINIADFLSDGYREYIDHDEVDDAVWEQLEEIPALDSDIEMEPAELPPVAEVLDLLQGIRFKNVYLLAFLNSGKGVLSGTINTLVQKRDRVSDGDGVTVEVFKDMEFDNEDNKPFPYPALKDSGKSWDYDIAGYTSDNSLTRLINSGQESEIKVVIDKNLKIKSFKKSNLEISIEIAIILPMDFDINEDEAERIILKDADGEDREFIKFEIEQLDDMQDEVNKQLDELADGVKDLFKDVKLYISDIQNGHSGSPEEFIKGMGLAIAKSAKPDAGELWDKLIPLENGQEEVIEFPDIKKLPKIALALSGSCEGFSIRPAKYDEDNNITDKFDFRAAVEATLNIGTTFDLPF